MEDQITFEIVIFGELTEQQKEALKIALNNALTDNLDYDQHRFALLEKVDPFA